MKPASTVEVWTEGDLLWIALPDQQTINIPAAEPARLITLLKAREAAVARGLSRFNGMGVGTECAPPQLTIYDAFKEAAKADKANKAMTARVKRANRDWERKKARDFLKSIGLTR